MKKLNGIVWTLFTLNGVILSAFVILNDKERLIYTAVGLCIICTMLHILHIKEEREKSLKYIKR